MRTSIGVLAALLAAVAAALSPAATAPSAPLFGLLFDGSSGAALVRVDADTLSPLESSTVRTSGLVTASLSPDGTKLQAGARIVNAQTLAVEADLRPRFRNVVFASA